MNLILSELEGILNRKKAKAKEISKIKEGYLAELPKLEEELAILLKENAALMIDKNEREKKTGDLEGEINEMKSIIAGLSMVKKGLNKYVEGPK